MNQKIDIQLEIPEEYVLIKKDEYNELKESQFLFTGDMAWLCEATKIKTAATLSEIMYANREKVEDFVRFPGEGGHWGFLKQETMEFARNNWELFKKRPQEGKCETA